MLFPAKSKTIPSVCKDNLRSLSVKPTGPIPAKIMIVGEFPGSLEMTMGLPFAGWQGAEFDRLLHEAGILRSQCFVTLVLSTVPPKASLEEWVVHKAKKPSEDFVTMSGVWVSPSIVHAVERLKGEIERVRPNVIITMGNLGLLSLAGKIGVKKWRGSVLPLTVGSHSCKLVPVQSLDVLQADWTTRAVLVHDLRRALRESESPTYKRDNNTFVIRPSYAEAASQLYNLLRKVEAGPTPISVDIETRAGHIACIGFAANRTEAFCIPLMCVERDEGYWTAHEETSLVQGMRLLMTHPNAQCFGQNFLYDCQYIYRHWLFIPRVWYDTMIAHHVMFPGTQKSLDYLASLYCDKYIYWKDDGKNWDPKVGEDQLWSYNCEDCVRTFEIMEQQFPALKQMGLYDVWDFQQNRLFPLLFNAMQRGIRADVPNKQKFAFELRLEITERETWLQEVLGHPINIRSPKQMQELFYGDLKFKPIFNRKTKSVTVDDKALAEIAVREPAIRPMIRRIQELRSLGVFLSTFVEARLDRDQRIRCSFNPAGTDTYRLSSSENAFGSGLNLQNIPSGSEADDHTALSLPNVRKLFIPDPGCEMFDMDLDRADLQVVVAEAEDEELRQAMVAGIDIHSLNAITLFGLRCEVEHVKARYNDKRQIAKSWVHGTNYGGGARTMAKTCGLTVSQAEHLQRRWFEAHPGIKKWHERTLHLLQTKRMAINRFGYRFIFFDRIEAALPQALAWVPQSTVACVINRAWDNIARQVPEAEVLIQVHDSLVGQYPAYLAPSLRSRIIEAAKVVIPYDKPLTIPAGMKVSEKSWGDCK